MGFKLNKIARAGVAIGLSAILALGMAGCGTNYSSYNSSTGNDSSYSQSYTNDYIDVITSNEFRVYDESINKTPITINNVNYLDFIQKVNQGDFDFEYAEYYGLDEALALYNSTKVNKSTSSTLLDASGKLDAGKLQAKVLENNKIYMSKGKDAINTFYSDISSGDLTMICNTIAEVVNSKFNDTDIAKVANTLMDMTCFQRTGSASNAYVTNNLTFVYNPNMSGLYADMQEIQGTSNSKEETLKQVITHEVMHILQYSASDTNDKNGLESGICRMYNLPNQDAKVPVDSLWNSWLLEAAAEMGMAEYMNIAPGTYAKKISYAKSYNLSRFDELDLGTQAIEDVAFNHTLEEAYKDLEIYTDEEKREFLNFLYSVEITQSDPEDFWANYTAKTGITPTDQEKLAIRMDIRADAVKFLSKQFYNNLADSIQEGKVTDLGTVFYLMRNWELDVYGHLEYTKAASLDHAKDFIIWHNQVQNDLFQALAQSNNMTAENIQSQYLEYNLQASINDTVYDNCNFANYNAATATYITSAKDAYSTSRFARNDVVCTYIMENEKTQQAEPSYTK